MKKRKTKPTLEDLRRKIEEMSIRQVKREALKKTRGMFNESFEKD